MIKQKKNNIDMEALRQKAKERTVRTQNIEYTPEMILKRVERGEIKINPDYQRNHRWDDKTSARLIESLILNIPIPLIYLSQDIDLDDETGENVARYSVIDGQQRLTAIVNFFNNELALTELETFDELNGLYFNDLPNFLKRRLEDRGIKFLRIDSTVDSELKYYIFEKLNRGSVNLAPQELRNSIYRGEFNNLLKKLAKYDNFRTLLQMKNETKVKKMEDIEMVLRFFAFAFESNYLRFKNEGLEKFLSKYMKNMNIRLQSEKNLLDELEEAFYRIIDFIVNNFGEQAFAKYNKINVTTFNKSLFDALITSLYTNVDLKNTVITEKFKKEYKELFNNTTNTDKINYRIETIINLLKKHKLAK